MRRLAVALAPLAALALMPGAVRADSFEPVTLSVSVAPVARLGVPLPVQVTVRADPSVLDLRDGPLRARVKLTAGECGGSFDATAGTVLLDRRLRPQPNPGLAYSGSARGAGRPSAFGTMAVCVYLEDENEHRQFASDTSGQVLVSRPCTSAASRYDRANAALARARRALRRARGARARAVAGSRLAAARRTANATRRSAARACGAGVAL